MTIDQLFSLELVGILISSIGLLVVGRQQLILQGKQERIDLKLQLMKSEIPRNISEVLEIKEWVNEGYKVALLQTALDVTIKQMGDELAELLNVRFVEYSERKIEWNLQQSYYKSIAFLLAEKHLPKKMKLGKELDAFTNQIGLIASMTTKEKEEQITKRKSYGEETPRTDKDDEVTNLLQIYLRILIMLDEMTERVKTGDGAGIVKV